VKGVYIEMVKFISSVLIKAHGWYLIIKRTAKDEASAFLISEQFDCRRLFISICSLE
jgi:hypothetical protein